MSEVYSRAFFEAQRDDSLISARIIVPSILALLQPRSVVDVGCGTGTWLSIFVEHGVDDITGIDGAYVEPDTLLIPSECFRAYDLTRLLPCDRGYNLALSLEVAEHLPARVANQFIDSLCRLAPCVLFSAAMPAQRGEHHVNEQWPWYWHRKFRERGYMVLDPFRPLIWYDNRVAPWYRQNLFLMVKRETWEDNTSLKSVPEVPDDEPLMLISASVLVSNLRLRSTLKRLPALLLDGVVRKLLRQERHWPWHATHGRLWHERGRSTLT